MVIGPRVFNDERGYFFESYNKSAMEKIGIFDNFVQDNQSKSKFGVIRGLHYQGEPSPQSKLVRVLQGSIFDVAVDIRKGSPSFGKWFGIELSSENGLQLYIPRGFAHGFSVLAETSVVLYKCDNGYNKEAEGGIIYSDTLLNIDWKIPAGKQIVSPKDKLLPGFKSAMNHFTFT